MKETLIKPSRPNARNKSQHKKLLSRVYMCMYNYFQKFKSPMQPAAAAKWGTCIFCVVYYNIRVVSIYMQCMYDESREEKINILHTNFLCFHNFSDFFGYFLCIFKFFLYFF